MALTESFRQQVALLLRTIPFVAKETCFALKGGTAINLFYRDLPRLSVDIDLTYVRAKSLGASVLGLDVTPAQLTLMPEKSAATKKRSRNRTNKSA